MNQLENIRLFCLDMDGTIYIENQLIPHVKETIEKLRKQGKIVFLTNNSSKSAAAYIDKLHHLGIEITADEIYTSGMATCEYLKANYADKKIYLVGTEALIQEFQHYGLLLDDQNPDLVVLGYDTTITYEKLVNLTKFLNMGKLFIATHPDINCPATPYYVPDIGSFLTLIETSCQRKPDIIIGKPETIMGQTLMQRFSLKKEEIAMVGDRLVTDIAFANRNGFTSILVFSGETTKEQYQKQDIKADYTFSDITKITPFLKK